MPLLAAAAMYRTPHMTSSSSNSQAIFCASWKIMIKKTKKNILAYPLMAPFEQSTTTARNKGIGLCSLLRNPFPLGPVSSSWWQRTLLRAKMRSSISSSASKASLDGSTSMATTEAMRDIIVKIMVEVLGIFGIVTKEMKQGRARRYQLEEGISKTR
ncbi:hypothetical protein EDB83DRAFT_2678660 [Lactarius deliciosus]|nr:hypothetical protein EDB83DRAFT_2678660 [Lactarius deliciosus]